LSFDNFTGDLQGMEEGNFGWVETGWAGGDGYCDWCELADLGLAVLGERFNPPFELRYWFFGENHGDSLLNKGKNIGKLRNFGVMFLMEFVVIFSFYGGLKADIYSFSGNGLGKINL